MATFPIVAAYLPSGPHGWPVTPATTIGGHVASAGDGELGPLAYSQIPDAEFRGALENAFPNFSFFYLGGLLGHYRFNVRSHSVSADGRRADLYVVLDADKETLDPATLRWIQIADGRVDSGGRAHPFYPAGGLAADGLVSFYATWTGTRSAKAYLAHDTGHRDRIGRDIVTLLGGVSYSSVSALAASKATMGAS
jgi:hypothetical protein